MIFLRALKAHFFSHYKASTTSLLFLISDSDIVVVTVNLIMRFQNYQFKIAPEAVSRYREPQIQVFENVLALWK